MTIPLAESNGSAGRTRRANPVLLVAATVLATAAVGYLGYKAWQTLSPQWASGGPALASLGPGDDPLTLFNTDNLAVPRSAILSGGPPKDGIPALTVGDHDQPPNVAPIDKARQIPGDQRVVGVTIGDQSRAYPIGVLNWHEAVNDTLGGRPIAVIYCPLCDSVSVVGRRIEGRTLEFGISGLLMNSNVLLYDRQTDSLWSQAKLEAISGPYAGRSLEHLGNWTITTFDDWKKAHPDSTVLTFETGHNRRYRRNPYGGYFRHDRLMFPVRREDDRLARKTRVIGVRLGDKAVAYPVERIAAAEDGRLRDQVDGKTVVLKAEDDGDVVVEQIPDEAQVIHTFWFAWAAFHPQTRIAERQPPDAGAD